MTRPGSASGSRCRQALACPSKPRYGLSIPICAGVFRNGLSEAKLPAQGHTAGAATWLDLGNQTPGPLDTSMTQACASGRTDGATLPDWGQQPTSSLEAGHWSGPLENGADLDRWCKVLPPREKKRGVQAGGREARSKRDRSAEGWAGEVAPPGRQRSPDRPPRGPRPTSPARSGLQGQTVAARSLVSLAQIPVTTPQLCDLRKPPGPLRASGSPPGHCDLGSQGGGYGHDRQKVLEASGMDPACGQRSTTVCWPRR